MIHTLATQEENNIATKMWWFYCHACLLRFFCLSELRQPNQKRKKAHCHSFYGHFIRIEMWLYCVFFGTDSTRIHLKWEKCDQKKDLIHFMAQHCVHTPVFGTRVNQTIMLKLNESIFFHFVLLFLLLWCFVYVPVCLCVSLSNDMYAQTHQLFNGWFTLIYDRFWRSFDAWPVCTIKKNCIHLAIGYASPLWIKWFGVCVCVRPRHLKIAWKHHISGLLFDICRIFSSHRIKYTA